MSDFDLSHISHSVDDLVKFIERGQRSVDNIETSTHRILVNARGVAAVNPFLRWATAFGGIGASITRTSDRLQQASAGYTSAKRQLQAAQLADQKFINGTDLVIGQRNAAKQWADVAPEIRAAQRAVAFYEKQLRDLEPFHTALTAANYHVKAAMESLAASIPVQAFASVYQQTVEFNAAYKQANPTLAERNRLLDIGLRSIQTTGLRAETVRDVQKGIIDLGMENNVSQLATVKTLGMLVEGLDVSVEHGVQLTQVFSNLGQNITPAAALIAQIARDTALSADEATRYTASLGESVRRSSSRNQASNVTGLAGIVLPFEAAAKQVSAGDVGKLEKLITDINSSTTGLGRLYRTNGRISDAASAQPVMDTLRGFAAQLAQIQSNEMRQVLAAQYEQNYQVPKDFLLDLSQIFEKEDAQRHTQGTLEEAYNANQKDPLGRLFREFDAFYTLALKPVTSGMRSLTVQFLNWTDDMHAWLRVHTTIREAVQHFAGAAGAALLVTTLVSIGSAFERFTLRLLSIAEELDIALTALARSQVIGAEVSAEATLSSAGAGGLGKFGLFASKIGMPLAIAGMFSSILAEKGEKESKEHSDTFLAHHYGAFDWISSVAISAGFLAASFQGLLSILNGGYRLLEYFVPGLLAWLPRLVSVITGGVSVIGWAFSGIATVASTLVAGLLEAATGLSAVASLAIAPFVIIISGAIAIVSLMISMKGKWGQFFHDFYNDVDRWQHVWDGLIIELEELSNRWLGTHFDTGPFDTGPSAGSEGSVEKAKDKDGVVVALDATLLSEMRKREAEREAAAESASDRKYLAEMFQRHYDIMVEQKRQDRIREDRAEDKNRDRALSHSAVTRPFGGNAMLPAVGF